MSRVYRFRSPNGRSKTWAIARLEMLNSATCTARAMSKNPSAVCSGAQVSIRNAAAKIKLKVYKCSGFSVGDLTSGGTSFLSACSPSRPPTYPVGADPSIHRRNGVIRSSPAVVAASHARGDRPFYHGAT